MSHAKDQKVIAFFPLFLHQKLYVLVTKLKSVILHHFQIVTHVPSCHISINHLKVDAVWAGWGHASENPELPRKLKAENIVFIGPPSEAMKALGDKIDSSIIAQARKKRCIRPIEVA